VKTALSQLEVVRPRDLAHALKLLHASLADGRLVPLAGGTDLYVYLHAGTQAGTRFLDLSTLEPLKTIRAGRGSVRIGALATFDAIARHPACAAWPMLPQAARVVGAAQIQNRATIGGNIANASPAGDSLPVLLAYDAVVRVASVRGERDIPFAELYTGYRRLAVEPDELIVSVSLPERPEGTIEVLRKVGTRAAQSISKVVFAGVIRRGRGGIVNHARLAWGSVAPTTIRATGAESALMGSLLDPAAVERSLAALDGDIAPIDDIRSDREYRADVARALLARFLGAASAPAHTR
jgi:CO/xanthine dehydrogenase FAD-binding subunit